jgi:hypothetical protein
MTQEELIEAITHVTLYAGWPKGMAAMGVPSNSSQATSKEKHVYRTLHAHLEKPTSSQATSGSIPSPFPPSLARRWSSRPLSGLLPAPVPPGTPTGMASTFESPKASHASAAATARSSRFTPAKRFKPLPVRSTDFRRITAAVRLLRRPRPSWKPPSAPPARRETPGRLSAPPSSRPLEVSRSGWATHRDVS